MPAPPIPGLYYDEEKKKYFKITNGTLNSQSSVSKYHNNTIQAKCRRDALVTTNTSLKSRKTRAVPSTHDSLRSEKCRKWSLMLSKMKAFGTQPCDIVNVLTGDVNLRSLYHSQDIIDHVRHVDVIYPQERGDSSVKLGEPWGEGKQFKDKFLRNVLTELPGAVCNWNQVVIYREDIHSSSNRPNTLHVSQFPLSHQGKNVFFVRIYYGREDVTLKLLSFVAQLRFDNRETKNLIESIFGLGHIEFDRPIPLRRARSKPRDLEQDIARVNEQLDLIRKNKLDATAQANALNMINDFIASCEPKSFCPGSYKFCYNHDVPNLMWRIVDFALVDQDLFMLCSSGHLIRIQVGIASKIVSFKSFTMVKLTTKSTSNYSQIAVHGNSIYTCVENTLTRMSLSKILQAKGLIASTSVEAMHFSLPGNVKRFQPLDETTFIVAYDSKIERVILNDAWRTLATANCVRPSGVTNELIAPYVTCNTSYQCIRVIGHHVIIDEGESLRIVSTRRTPALEGNVGCVRLVPVPEHTPDQKIHDIRIISDSPMQIGVTWRCRETCCYGEYTL